MASLKQDLSKFEGKSVDCTKKNTKIYFDIFLYSSSYMVHGSSFELKKILFENGRHGFLKLQALFESSFFFESDIDAPNPIIFTFLDELKKNWKNIITLTYTSDRQFNQLDRVQLL